MQQAQDQRTPTPLIAGLVGGAFALLGILKMPYGYYSAMRIAIVSACVVMTIGAIARRKPFATAPLIFVALFVMFVKGLSKDTWQAIDLGVAVLLVVLGAWLAQQPVRDGAL